jgi:DNA-binding XRE family transcriptional regulator
MRRKQAKRVIRPRTGPIDKYFGDRLRARRIMIKMSQEELADKVGVSFQQIQKMKRVSTGSVRPRW